MIIDNNIFKTLKNFYENKSFSENKKDFNCFFSNNKKDFIGKNKNNEYNDFLNNIQIKNYKDCESISNPNFIKRFPYKTEQVSDGKVRMKFNFNGIDFSNNNNLLLVLATTSSCTRNDKTKENIRKRIVKNGGDYNKFFKLDYELSNLKSEMEIPLKTNEKENPFINNFIIINKQNNEVVAISDPFSLISTKQLFKRKDNSYLAKSKK
eukprot:jgi/Orpsp1_1/1174523/evm.model.c7180000050445.1